MPETARTRQKRAEGLCGGAGKGCYGKSAQNHESDFYIFPDGDRRTMGK
ncbi:hypothetical protein DZ11C13_45130 [Escherichia coli]